LPLLHRPQILRERLSDSNVPVIQGSSLKQAEALRDSILEAVKPMLPEAEKPLYDVELYTLSSTRELCAEIVREKCFEQLHQEVPFGLAVKIVRFDEDSGPLVRIIAEIMVSKENHRPIVIGRDGSVLKKIGTEARKEMEKLLDRRVYLDLNVTSKRNWQKNPGVMKDLGYVVPKA
jgi:GTP-binding protein Era